MTEQITKNGLDQGKIRFVDNWIPLLEAGDYTITVTQSLQGSGAYTADSDFTETQEFTVSAPRFSLDPADLYAMYPPPNSQGIFGHDLPHIVLTKRALPWERGLFKNADGTDDRAVPWMALVLFNAAQILTPAVGSNAVGSDDGSEAPNPTGVTTIPVSKLLEPEQKVIVGQYDHKTLDEADLKRSCQVIDILPETFKDVMPPRQHVKYLAHCREVDMTSKGVPGPAHPGAATGAGNGTEWYSVVVGGRLPRPPAPGQAGVLNVVHLLSLEGFETYLDDPRHATFPDGTERIRLVSLVSWSFTCLRERGESFSRLMQGLVAGGSEQSLELKLPVQPPGQGASPEEFAYQALEAGYVPLSYHTRQGEQTFAWYRGPFTPRPVARLPADRKPFLTSAQAAVYDQEHGLFDLSYAVAWEIGRLLALSDQRFGVLLLNWRRQTHGLVDLLWDRTGHGSLQGIRAASSGPQRFHDLLGQNLVSETFTRHLVGHLTEGIDPAAVKPLDRQFASARPEPAVPANTPVSLTEFAQDSSVQQFATDIEPEEHGPICDWLAKLYLLYGVPFNYLVANERLLPPESIRFFYLDRNWLEALLDGALSIGVQSSRDVVYQKPMRDKIRQMVQTEIHTVRGKLRGIQSEVPADAGQVPMAGLLLRSAVVSGWPGLEVRAYDSCDDEQKKLIEPLRMDRLSENVLLCLFPQAPAWIEFDEPKEGLHFGLEVEDERQVIGLRYAGEGVGEGGETVGELLLGKTVESKQDGCRNLDIQGLVDQLVARKSELGLEDDEFGPAALALQMVRVPEQMVFQTTESA